MTDTTQYIRLFALANLLLGVMYIASSFILESHLHPLLQEYLQAEAERESTTFEDLLFLIAIPLVVAHLTSLFGLIFVKRWAKHIYIFSLVVLIVFSLFIGPFVDHAISYTIDGLNGLVAGIIVALLMFTKSQFH